MNIIASRTRLAGLALGLVLLAGCSGDYLAYRGQPKAFSTHPYRMVYPNSFVHSELQQVKPGMVLLNAFTEAAAVPTDTKEIPGVIFVRCYRMRGHETSETFMERYYDDLALRYLDIEMRKIEGGSNPDEWLVMVETLTLYMATRVIVLPDEKLAYDVSTMCGLAGRERFEDPFRRTRDSFELLPARE